MKTYQQRKNEARQAAIDWTLDAKICPMSRDEIKAGEAYIARIARRYGLITEFRTDGII